MWLKKKVVAGEDVIAKDSSIGKTIKIIIGKITKIVSGIEEELNNRRDWEWFGCYY